MKKFMAIVLLAELMIACFAGASTFAGRQFLFHRRAHLSAFMQWLDHQTPETRAELDRQNRISAFYRAGFSSLVFGVMAGPTLLAGRAWSRKEPAQSLSENAWKRAGAHARRRS